MIPGHFEHQAHSIIKPLMLNYIYGNTTDAFPVPRSVDDVVNISKVISTPFKEEYLKSEQRKEEKVQEAKKQFPWLWLDIH